MSCVDDKTGLYYYRARYYEPKFGRFISEDPIRFAGGMNFYAYVGNNPVTHSDPFGLAEPGTLTIGSLWAWGATSAAATGKGAAVLAGAGTGAALVGAGTAGWFIGRGIGHVPIGDGRTVDDAVTSAFASIITFSRGDARTTARSWRSPTCKPRNKKECEALYVADTALCNQLKSRACHAQAAERYAACLAGKDIPPLPWRREQ